MFSLIGLKRILFAKALNAPPRTCSIETKEGDVNVTVKVILFRPFLLRITTKRLLGKLEAKNPRPLPTSPGRTLSRHLIPER